MVEERWIVQHPCIFYFRMVKERKGSIRSFLSMKKERSNRLPGFFEKSFWSNYSGIIAGIILVVAVGLILYWPQIPRGTFLANLFSARNYSTVTNVGEAEQTLTPATREAKEGIEKNPSFPEPPKKTTPQQMNLNLPATPLKANDSAGESITMVAVKGQGVTHLARFALQRYLSEQKPKATLTKEHKIFIEDFLKDSFKKIRLHPESELTFSLDLITKAITASQNLTPTQLNNLMRYSKKVPSLSAYTPTR